MVSGSIVLQRWGRWETCIDFSFCWGKQACCSWARVQWGRPNVLDCSSSLSPVSCDGYETPWKQLIQKTMKTLSICVFVLLFLSFCIQDSASAQGDNVSDCIIRSKESWWRKFGHRSREETKPASPQRAMSESWPELAIVQHSRPCRAEMLVKHIAWCHRS